MADPKSILKWTRVVPVRFTRAIAGPPQANAPDVDDRGFKMGTRPGDWGHSNTRGAMVAIAQGDTVHVKVLREDIDNRADLYVTSTDTNVVEVVLPIGLPIPPDGIFQIRGVKDFKNRPMKIQVHLGGFDGPVLGELEPHVFRRRLLRGVRFLRVLVHFVTINGPPPPPPLPPAVAPPIPPATTARTIASLVPLFNAVNAIWRPAGIQFQNPPETRNTTVNGVIRGQVTTNMSGPGRTGTRADWAEFSTLINTNHRANRINIYCVHDAPEFMGLTYDNDIVRPNGYGVVIKDGASFYDLAHELGHFLNNDNHADANAAGTDPDYTALGARHRNMWMVRRLMFSDYPPSPPPTGSSSCSC